MIGIDGGWQIGIGDPTPMGWATVAGYLSAAWVCWKAHAEAAAVDRQTRRAKRFWLLLVTALVLLGINKQLDLQTGLTHLGRALAHQGGWYEQRHAVQIGFIVAVGSAAVGALGALGWLSRPWSPGRLTALGGLLYVAAFVLIRASSFHGVDLFLHRTVLGWRWNWILELSGIALTGLGAVVERLGVARAGDTGLPTMTQPGR